MFKHLHDGGASLGVQLVAEPDRTTTMRRSPLPLVQFTSIW